LDDPRDAPLSPPDFHHGAWLLWLVAATVPALWTRNPLYLALVLTAVAIPHLRLRRTGDPRDAPGWGALLRLGMLLALLTALVPPLLVHAGKTVLFHLPSLTLPVPGVADPPRLGGPVTLESLAYGVSTALGLTALLLVFATFNLATDPYSLLRALPRSLARSGVVLSIAVTFVPLMMEAQREIREAQALRGHRFRGLRDLVPLFVVLLAEGLERSITLAESLEARGFSAGARSPNRGARTALLGGFTLLVAGAALRIWRPGFRGGAPLPLGNLVLLLGLLTLVAALLALGRSSRRTRLRRAVWRRRDTALAGAAALSLALVLVTHLTGGVSGTESLGGGGGLGWYPYPRFIFPAVDPLGAAGLVLLAAPAWLIRFPIPEPGDPR